MKLTKLVLSLVPLSLALHAQAPADAPDASPRLVCLFLDLASMDAAGQSRARDAAIDWVQRRPPSNDLFSVMTYDSQVEVLTDFTRDRNSVVTLLRTMPVSATGNNNAGAKLRAIQTAASMISNLPEKKVMVYISGGIQPSSALEQDQMEATIDALHNANIVMYPLDARGLTPQQ